MNRNGFTITTLYQGDLHIILFFFYNWTNDPERTHDYTNNLLYKVCFLLKKIIEPIINYF